MIKFELEKDYVNAYGNIVKLVYKNDRYLFFEDKDLSLSLTRHDGTLYDGSGFNIVSEHLKKPVVNWDNFANWTKYIAMDKDGNWWCYADKPILSSNYWYGLEPQSIPEDYAPKNYKGDWKNSLIERP